jgi:CubicO group peptidase (beta-lactamase class C family)
MKRRTFLHGGVAISLGTPVLAAVRQGQWDAAADVLAQATATGLVSAASLWVSHHDVSFSRAFGKASSEHAMFLLGSISKPMAVTALMTLFDRGVFKLSDPVVKFIPQFSGDGREAVTMQHLLTHVSGLPDQLAENDALRRSHASLDQFAEKAARAPLSFAPGTKYQYSSMAILLASRVAELISGHSILQLVERAVFQPLEMEHSAQGLGRFKLEELVPVQTEHAAPEAGGGDPTAKDWDWNSRYWRSLGAPWGGTHCSAPDVGRFLMEFLHAAGAAVKPATARLMVTNHNPPGLTPRGLGLAVGSAAGSKGCSELTFGHTGSTGTIAWADPKTRTICVVLTSLPGHAVQPHPREVAGDAVAAAAG